MNARMLMPLTCMLLLAGGCRTFTCPARKHMVKAPNASQVVWFDYDATRRGTLVMDRTQKLHVLAEPAPDAAMATVADFVGKVTYKGITGETSGKVTESIAELGKRTQTIMFLREAMYRLNELQTSLPGNGKLEKAEIMQLYTEVLNVSLQVALADKARELGQAATAMSEVGPAERTALLRQFGAMEEQISWSEMQGRPLPDGFKASIGSEEFVGKGKTGKDYAEFLVMYDKEFKGKTLSGIAARGGEPLVSLMNKVKQAFGSTAP